MKTRTFRPSSPWLEGRWRHPFTLVHENAPRVYSVLCLPAIGLATAGLLSSVLCLLSSARRAVAPRSRVLWLAGLLACVALGGAGCGKRETPVQAGIRTQTLLVGNLAEPADLDPHVASSQAERTVLFALFEGLTAPDENGNGVPAAAEKWDVSTDGLTWTFHLRPNLRWCNGEPMTAADFVFSFRRALNPRFPNDYSYLLWPIRGAEAFNKGRSADFATVGARALDDRTLRIDLEHPTPYLLGLACQWVWWPVHRTTLEKFGALEKRGTVWTRPGNIVGNGPFALKEWSPNSRIAVTKNPHYWNAAQVRLNGVVFYPIERAEVEENNFRAGQLHVTWEVPITKIAGYRGQQPSPLRVQSSAAPIYLYFNTARPPLDDARVRRALSLAIDRDAISRAVTNGVYPPAHAFTAPNLGGYTAHVQVRCDFETARRLLAQAGFAGGKGMPELPVQTRDADVRVRSLEAIQAMWQRELGVRMAIERMELKTILQNAVTKNYTAGVLGWPADYPDPAALLELWVTNGSNNHAGWSNADYDRLLERAARTPDPRARIELLQQAEALLLDEAPVAPIIYSTRAHLVHPAVKGWATTTLMQDLFDRVWLSN
jgi:oligopeptide transport system substrate-binding protein